jgi:hypothetical protein
MELLERKPALGRIARRSGSSDLNLHFLSTYYVLVMTLDAKDER